MWLIGGFTRTGLSWRSRHHPDTSWVDPNSDITKRRLRTFNGGIVAFARIISRQILTRRRLYLYQTCRRR